MKTRHYREFLSDLKELLRSGVPVADALGYLEDQGARRPAPQREFTAAVVRSMRAGQSLSEALAAHAGTIPNADVAIIRAGEEAGKLEEMLDSILRAIDARREIVDEISKQLWWNLATAVIAVLLLPLPIVVQSGLGTYLLIQACFWLPVAAIVWSIRRGPALFAAGSSARDRYERFRMRVPVWGAISKRFALARVFDVLGRLLAAGVSFREGLPLAATATEWLTMRRTLRRVEENLEAGASVADSFLPLESYLASGWRQRLVVGETAGSLERSFVEIAAGWEREALARTKGVLRAIVLALPLVVGVFVAYSALRVFGSLGV